MDGERERWSYLQGAAATTGRRRVSTSTNRGKASARWPTPGSGDGRRRCDRERNPGSTPWDGYRRCDPERSRAAASMCSVGELRAGEEGSGPDLAGDDAGAAQCVEVLPRTDGGRRRRMNPKKTKNIHLF